MVRSQGRGLTINAVSPSTSGDLAGNDTLLDTPYRSSQDTQPYLAAPTIPASRLQRNAQPRPYVTKDRRSSVRSESLARPLRESPFRDNRGSVGTRSFHVQGFSGQVSSYLKFEWSKQKPRKPAQQPLGNHLPYKQRGGLHDTQLEIMFPHGNGEQDPSRLHLSTAFLPATASMNFGPIAAGHVQNMPPESLLLNPGYSAFATEIESSWPDNISMGSIDSTTTDIPMSITMSPQEPTTLQTSLSGSPVHSGPLVAQRFGDWEERRKQEEREKREEVDKDPKLLPNQFGLPAKLNYYQRRFNVFCEWPSYSVIFSYLRC